MKIIKLLLIIICPFLGAQELRINNEYIFTGKDSVFIKKSWDVRPVYDTIYYETVWELFSIDNKLSITLLNNQDKPLLFYLDPINIDTELNDSMVIYGKDFPIFELLVYNKNGEKLKANPLDYNVLDRIEYFGNPMEENSFLNKGNWKSVENKYENIEPYLYVLKPGEKVLLFIDLRLPSDNILTRAYTYDFSSFDLDSMKIIFWQNAEELKSILTKQILETLEKERIEIFDGALESNNVEIIELRR